MRADNIAARVMFRYALTSMVRYCELPLNTGNASNVTVLVVFSLNIHLEQDILAESRDVVFSILSTCP
jgi:hypothetical protein